MNTEIFGILPFQVFVLPPGSTSAALQAAINSAVSGDVIEISSDINFTSTITVPAGITITIQSGAGSNWVLTRTVSNARHFTLNGDLVLQNITLSGGDTGGGVTVNSAGSLTINNGTVIQFCIAANGGGVQVNNGGSFQMNGGEITENRSSGTASTNGGGGIYGASTGIITIIGGVISNNTAASSGGGVSGYMIEISAGVLISGNTANSNGGGVYINTGGTLQMAGGIITGNTANGVTSTTNGGGGVFGFTSSVITISGGTISNNTAAASGGGIFGYTSSMITVSGNTVIGSDNADEGNTAGSYGGAIYGYSNSTVTISGSVIISYNMAANGGGIGCIGNGANLSHVIIGGMAQIGNNRATSRGGGIGVFSSTGTTIVLHTITVTDDAVIAGNTAISGGGIYAYDGGIVQVGGGRVSKNTASNGGGIYAGRNSAVTVSGGSMTLNEAGVNGGGIFIIAASVNVSGGIIHQNTAAGIGGGICSYHDFRGVSSLVGATYASQITVMGGSIAGNTAVSGGGIGSFNAFDSAGSNNVAECVITVEGGEISGNIATENGGGIYSYAYSQSGSKFSRAGITVTGGNITGNTTQGSGGGIYSYNYGGTGGTALASCVITIENASAVSNNTSAVNGGGVCGIALTASICRTVLNNGIVSNNTALLRGGGIYVTTPATVEVAGASFITNNSAPNGDGGGIYTEAVTYNNLMTGSGTVFSGNSASRAFRPPANAAVSYPNIQFASASITNHPLNNYDINFTSGEPLAFFHIIYNANGGTGGFIGSDVISGGTDTVLSPEEAGVSRESHTFMGWNTRPDGSGAAYEPGDVITLTDNVTLYAQWLVSLFGVTYEANGGAGGFADTNIPYGTLYTILFPEQVGISRTGYTFTGWNTQPDGSGTSFQPGSVIVVTGDLTLYAQWAVNLYMVLYTANAGTGSFIDADIPYGTEYAILFPNEAGINREGFIFTGWNTEPDGSGTVYEPGDVTTITMDLTLYAQWNAPNLFAINYNANGGEGGFVDTNIPYGTMYTILSPEEVGISRIGYTLTGWNIEPDGSGTVYEPGDVITISSSLILYAQWRHIEKPVCPPPCHIQCCSCFAQCCMTRCYRKSGRKPCCKAYCRPCIKQAINCRYGL